MKREEVEWMRRIFLAVGAMGVALGQAPVALPVGHASGDPRIGAEVGDSKAGLSVAAVLDTSTGKGILDIHATGCPRGVIDSYERISLAPSQFSEQTDSSGPLSAALNVANLSDPCHSGSTGTLALTWTRMASQPNAYGQPEAGQVFANVSGSYLNHVLDTSHDGGGALLIDYNSEIAQAGTLASATPLSPDRQGVGSNWSSPAAPPVASAPGGSSGAVKAAGQRAELPFTAAASFNRLVLMQQPVDYTLGRMTVRLVFAEEHGGDVQGNGYGAPLVEVYEGVITCIGPAVDENGVEVGTGCDSAHVMDGHREYLGTPSDPAAVTFNSDESGQVKLTTGSGPVDVSWVADGGRLCADPDTGNAPPATAGTPPTSFSGENGITACTTTTGKVLGFDFSPAESSYYRVEAAYAGP
ncbi:MAG: hypothetical protein ACYDAY_07780 [Candidatus Dormibacteria bacterium]